VCVNQLHPVTASRPDQLPQITDIQRARGQDLGLDLQAAQML